VVFGLCGVVALGGCASGVKPSASRAYPDELRQEKVIDVQVFRRTTEIEFTNTTDHVLGPGTLWLNKRFAAPIGEIGVGQRARVAMESATDDRGGRPDGSTQGSALPDISIGNTCILALTDTYDEFGDTFRAGGFFASEPPQRLVLVQIETVDPDQKPHMVGLIVVNSTDQ
jgi:hypothetical protein